MSMLQIFLGITKITNNIVNYIDFYFLFLLFFFSNTNFVIFNINSTIFNMPL